MLRKKLGRVESTNNQGSQDVDSERGKKRKDDLDEGLLREQVAEANAPPILGLEFRDGIDSDIERRECHIDGDCIWKGDRSAFVQELERRQAPTNGERHWVAVGKSSAWKREEQTGRASDVPKAMV